MIYTITVGEGACVAIKRKMDYIKFGNGTKKLVILPGLSVHSVLKFEASIKQAYHIFMEEYTVYVFDRAREIEEGYSIRDMSNDTAMAMKELGLEDADVFGASQGGMMGLCLAIDHPNLVNHLIVASSLARTNKAASKVIDQWIDFAKKKDEKSLLESFACKVYSEATLVACKDDIIKANRGISDEEYQRFIILARACKTFDCYAELTKIKAAVMVIGAKGDQVTTVEGSKEIAKALGCTSYLYDETYGHGVYDEASDFVERCKAFLESF